MDGRAGHLPWQADRSGSARGSAVTDAAGEGRGSGWNVSLPRALAGSLRAAVRPMGMGRQAAARPERRHSPCLPFDQHGRPARRMSTVPLPPSPNPVPAHSVHAVHSLHRCSLQPASGLSQASQPAQLAPPANALPRCERCQRARPAEALSTGTTASHALFYSGEHGLAQVCAAPATASVTLAPRGLAGLAGLATCAWLLHSIAAPSPPQVHHRCRKAGGPAEAQPQPPCPAHAPAA